MKLFIRSQNRERLIEAKDYYCCDDCSKFSIRINGCIFGLYETKERALEILDEIQKFLEHDIPLMLVPNSNRPFVVYEMPKA